MGASVATAGASVGEAVGGSVTGGGVGGFTGNGVGESVTGFGVGSLVRVGTSAGGGDGTLAGGRVDGTVQPLLCRT